MKLPTKELTSERVYGFGSKKNLSLEEKSLILEVVDECLDRLPSSKGVKLKPTKVSYINTTEEYDSYKVEGGEKDLFVRISFDEGNAKLTYEKQILKSLLNQRCSNVPKLYGSGNLLGMEYMVTSFENAPNINEAGWDSKNKDKFLTRLKEFQSFKKPRISKSMIDFVGSQTSLLGEDWTDQKIKEAERDKNYSFLTSLHQECVEALGSLVSKQLLNGKDLCHGDLSRKHVLTLGGDFKFTNLSKSHIGYGLEDAVNFAYSANTSLEELKELSFYYASVKGQQNIINPMIEAVGYMRTCKLISEYFKQTHLFEFSKPQEMFSDGIVFLNNAEIYEKFLRTRSLTGMFRIISKMMGQ